MLALLVQSGTFSDDFDVPLYQDSLLFCQGQFLFSLQLFVLQSYCTLKVYKFFGSISGVVSKNTACILKMILE